jgi:hypothetical protein
MSQPQVLQHGRQQRTLQQRSRQQRGGLQQQR